MRRGRSVTPSGQKRSVLAEHSRVAPTQIPPQDLPLTSLGNALLNFLACLTPIPSPQVLHSQLPITRGWFIQGADKPWV